VGVNIQDEEIERLIEQLAAITSESPAEVVRRALAERLAHIEEQAERRERVARLWHYLETEVWPSLPPGERGRVLSREEEDAILGYGPDGE
jgi:antitoxin VapB